MCSNTFISNGFQSMVSELDMSSIHPLVVNTSLTEEKFTDLWNYWSFEFWQNEGSPVSYHLPLLGGGPIPVLIIMGTYLLLVTKIGPWFMSKRTAYELRLPMLIYNIFMVVINAYFFFKTLSFIERGRVFMDFEFPSKVDDSPRAQDIIQTAYLYFLSKFVDLLDTVFFVLRKRQRQVSGLHLYHHTVVPLLGWLVMKLMPLVPALMLFAILNSFVHTIMYSYYALSGFGPSIQPYLWWKRYITQVQITQFIILIGYSLMLAKFQTGYPTIWTSIGCIQSPIFFYLFTDFYIKSYRKTIGKTK